MGSAVGAIAEAREAERRRADELLAQIIAPALLEDIPAIALTESRRLELGRRVVAALRAAAIPDAQAFVRNTSICRHCGRLNFIPKAED